MAVGPSLAVGSLSADCFPRKLRLQRWARSPDDVDVFVCDAVGQVHSARWIFNSEDGPGRNDLWLNISPFQVSTAAARVSAVLRSPDTLDVFISGLDHQVYWSSWSDAVGFWTGFSPGWLPLGGGKDPSPFPTAAPIATLSRDEGSIDLFVVANDGQVFISRWSKDGGGWLTPSKDWENVGGPAQFTSGYPLAVLNAQTDTLHLFGGGKDGRVYQHISIWIGMGWIENDFPWIPLGDVQKTVPAKIAAVARTQANIDIFVSGRDGRVKQTAWGG
jgi:hypothetical protein